MSEIYEGPVRIGTTDRDGNPLTIKKGKRAGQGFCKVSFKVGEEWVNLVDFSNDAAGYDGQVCKVAYSVKVDDFGDPDLYNGKTQYNLDAIKPTGPAPATQSPNAGTPAQTKGDIPPHISVRQTAANCASGIISSDCGATKAPTFDEWDAWFDHILARITGQVDLVQEAKDKLGAVEEEDDEDSIPF